MDAAGLGQLRRRHRHRRRLCRPPQLRHGGDRPHAGGAGLSRRHHRAARLAERRALQGAGPPNLFFGVTAGNMDSMINRYTADRKIRSDDAYTPGGASAASGPTAPPGLHPALPEAFGDVPIVLGGIEASLRRIAHYDYWQDKVRRSDLVDSKADLLLYGNAERAIVEIAHRLAAASRSSDHRRARHRLPAPQRRPRPAGLVRDRLHRGRPPGPHRRPHQPLPDDQRGGGGQAAGRGRRQGRARTAKPAPLRHSRSVVPPTSRNARRRAAAAARAHRDPPAATSR
jgi:radical SAM superfamily enzyme YgiQ (UPF0313 family)